MGTMPDLQSAVDALAQLNACDSQFHKETQTAQCDAITCATASKARWWSTNPPCIIATKSPVAFVL
jgi:hypothetical protein